MHYTHTSLFAVSYLQVLDIVITYMTRNSSEFNTGTI